MSHFIGKKEKVPPVGSSAFGDWFGLKMVCFLAQIAEHHNIDIEEVQKKVAINIILTHEDFEQDVANETHIVIGEHMPLMKGVGYLMIRVSKIQSEITGVSQKDAMQEMFKQVADVINSKFKTSNLYDNSRRLK